MDKRVDIGELRTRLDDVLAVEVLAVEAIWADADANKRPALSMDEIDEGIAACRHERRAAAKAAE